LWLGARDHNPDFSTPWSRYRPQCRLVEEKRERNGHRTSATRNWNSSYFTSEDRHPYDEVTWDLREARISNFRDGTVAFEQLGVEVPSNWSFNATNILAQKYFRGTLGTPERETSLKQVVDRIVDTITTGALEGDYFVDEEEAETFRAELKHLLITQKAAFNSPVCSTSA